jgi:hypothetical protein
VCSTPDNANNVYNCELSGLQDLNTGSTYGGGGGTSGNRSATFNVVASTVMGENVYVATPAANGTTSTNDTWRWAGRESNRKKARDAGVFFVL